MNPGQTASGCNHGRSATASTVLPRGIQMLITAAKPAKTASTSHSVVNPWGTKASPITGPSARPP